MRLLHALALSLIACATAVAEAPLWLRYPSISPDGTRIAFTYRGDLYRVSSSGGEAVALTKHVAQDAYPVWSPDGKRVAFASNRFGSFDVFVVDAEGGEPLRLTTHSGDQFPSDFTPDGFGIVFWGNLQDAPSGVLFPVSLNSELYVVPVEGGRARQLLTIPAEWAKLSLDGTQVLAEDFKGWEDDWRKHQRSAVTRDVWLHDLTAGTHTKLSDTEGEDRTPVWLPGGALAWVTDVEGSLNVVRSEKPGARPVPLTRHTKHPVRFLSASREGALAYSFDGELWVLDRGAAEPRKVEVRLRTEAARSDVQHIVHGSGATEFAVAPSGKEVVFVVRGDVFVVSTENSITRRITDTAQQERSASFSPDGRSIVFAAERSGNWDILRAALKREEDTYFYAAPILEEHVVVATEADEFQPLYSPDGKEIAFYENRTTLKVLNLEKKESRVVLPASTAYSYIDGDLSFTWSPDSKWLYATVFDGMRWSLEIALVDASGVKPWVNLTRSGYWDQAPAWGHKGHSLVWFTERSGLHPASITSGEWENDVYAMFLTQAALDRFSLSKDEFALLKEREEKEKEKKEKAEAKAKEAAKEKPAATDAAKNDSTAEAVAGAEAAKSKEDPEEDEEEKVEPLPEFELDGRDLRIRRLTVHSSRLADATLTPDGEQLVYLSKFEGGYDVWLHHPREGETKLLSKLDADRASMEMDKEGKHVFVLADGSLQRISLEDGESKPLTYAAEQRLRTTEERKYIFEHVWRQTLEKFHDPKMHGVDWAFYGEAYRKFLPHLGNNWELAEVLSEMAGELNASHMGSGYRPSRPDAENTASLGVLFDLRHKGAGYLVAEVLAGGPLSGAASKVRAGDLLESIGGVPLDASADLYAHLVRVAGRALVLGFSRPGTEERWEQVVKPIGRGAEAELLYQRWVRARRADVERLSGGRLGYVHVREMDDRSYREVFDQVLGLHAAAEGIVIDTRFNGGGNTSLPLVEFFAAKRQFTYKPRGQFAGDEPGYRWLKPSIVLVSESNYSDAHIFPEMYRQSGVGLVVGMPVPGTGTAVWWEDQIDPDLYYGIPQVTIYRRDGIMLENTQFEPDIRVPLDPAAAAIGRDTQLERAVAELLK